MDEEHLNLIRSLVWNLHKASGIDWDELFAEASLAYFVKLERYYEKKGIGKKSTMLITYISNKLLNFIQKENDNSFLQLEGLESEFLIIEQIPFFELFDALSEDSKIIVNMILKEPHIYLSLPSKMARGLVVRNLIEEMGWIVDRSWKGVRRLKNEINFV